MSKGMTKGIIAIAESRGADAKKLESIDNRLSKVLNDARKAGLTFSAQDGKLSILHKAGRSTMLLGSYDL